MTKDMTVGSPLRHILSFAIPVLLGNLFQQLYNVADTLIVGRFLGLNQLAGVGSTGSLSFLVIWFCTGTCNGFSIPIAQSFGGGRHGELRKYLANGIRMAVIIAAVVTTLVSVFCGPLLTAMKTPADIYEYAHAYIQIIFLGLPFTMLYNYTASIIRSLGDSKTPVLLLVMSSLINIVLDLVFILAFNMGVRGAALATVLAQLISGLTCVYHIYRRVPLLHMRKEDLTFSPAHTKELLRHGVPMGIRLTIIASGISILQVAVNSMGTNAVAAMTASGKIYGILSAPIMAVGQSLAPFSGQNIGARRLDRVSQGLRVATMLEMCVWIFGVLVSFFFGRQLIAVFVKDAPAEVIRLGYTANLINVSGFVFLIAVNTVPNILQGMGFSIASLITGITEVVGRIIGANLFAKWWGFVGVASASVMAWLLTALFAYPAYFILRKRLAQKFAAEDAQALMRA